MSIPFWPRLRMSARYRATRAANGALRPTGLRLVEASTLPPPIDVALAGFSIDDFDLRLRTRRGIEGRPPKASEGPISVIADDLEAIVPIDEFSGSRILEVGAKSGYHSRWIDRTLRPSRFVIVDLFGDYGYVEELEAPTEAIHANILTVDLADESFDLIVAPGLLYHTVEQFRLLGKLWRLLRPGGMLVLQSTTSPIESRLSGREAVIEVRWTGSQTGSYVLPSKTAVFTMLAMTGFNDIEWWPEYRTISSAVLLTARRQPEQPPSGNLGTPFALP